jgi:bifunctional DNA-binding transcriptional regulator/antitoxin component of YhaV-PrlF toxin-antitoxin module
MMKRKYTVGRKPGYIDNITPEIRIGGKWLSKAGINVGDRVELSVDPNLIIISLLEDKEEDKDEEINEKRTETPDAILRKKRARPLWVQEIYRKVLG